MDKQQALDKFWNSFGIAAYEETSVPDEAKPPYITYEFAEDGFNNEVAVSVSLWYYGDSWDDIDAKAKQIRDTLKRGGKSIRYDEGGVWVYIGSSRRMSEPENDMIRRIIINIRYEFFE